MRGRLFVSCLVPFALLALVACSSPSRVTYIPEGGDYRVGDLPNALLEADPGKTARLNSEDAAQVRQEALADLRTHGEDASALADTLTTEFPTDDASVPFAVERGTFEGEPAWIVFEAWGDAEGKLSHRRVWVFSYTDGMVLAAHSTP